MKIFTIAEIGINHNGDINLAKKLIKQAKDTGFDAVKFQKRTVEKVYSKDELNSYRESPWGKTFREQKLGLEFEKNEFDEINKFCNELKIMWSCSAWDMESYKFLQNYNLKFNKIASPMLTNYELAKTIAKDKIKTFISTGMSTLDEIDKTVEIFEKENCKFELMHCISQYPFENKYANLNLINTLKKRYNCPVGYSGHEKSGQIISWAAISIGASSLERHITIDRSMYGSDQSASLEEEGCKKLIKGIRAIEECMGDGQKEILEIEMGSVKKLKFKSND